MDNTQLERIKANLLCELRTYLPKVREQLCGIDSRLWQYVTERTEALEHFVLTLDDDGTEIEDCAAGLYELLGIRRFLRMLCTYQFDLELVKDIIFDAEGEWKEDERGVMQWQRGGLQIDGIYGYGHYRQTAMQVYAYAYIYGFKRWVDTTSPIGSRQMLPTERENRETGTIEDLRRVTREFTMMWPRKVAKSFAGAFIQYEGLMRGALDYEGYIVANSAQQSGILFKQLKQFITQMPGWEKYFRITDSDQNRQIKWVLKTSGKRAFVKALTKGPEGKDGLKGHTLSADEFGGAKIVKDHCDMEGLINVVKGSFGPCREPLTIHTSTAGLGTMTPYEMLTDSLKETLLEEMAVPLGSAQRFPTDWQGAIILQPDPWEWDEESLRDDHVIKKVNPNLGVTIQADFYENEWAEADKLGEGKRKEVITKLYNIFQSDKLRDWITHAELKPFIKDVRITQLNKQHWVAFCGMDFSKGDDLCSLGWVAFNPKSREVLWDCDCWIAEEQLYSNPNRAFYQQLQASGHLHVSPGGIINPDEVLAVVDEVSKHVRLMAFGYDAYDSLKYVTLLQNWMTMRMQKAGRSGKAIQDELKKRFVSVPQNFASYNAPVQMVWEEVHGGISIGTRSHKLTVANNPIIPWCFQNAVLAESTDGMENVKPVKRNENAKVDVAQCICSCYKIWGEWN